MPLYNPVVFLHVLKLVKDLHAFGFLRKERVIEPSCSFFLTTKTSILSPSFTVRLPLASRNSRCGNLALGFEIPHRQEHCRH